jgi:hypothetical protein
MKYRALTHKKLKFVPYHNEENNYYWKLQSDDNRVPYVQTYRQACTLKIARRSEREVYKKIVVGVASCYMAQYTVLVLNMAVVIIAVEEKRYGYWILDIRFDPHKGRVITSRRRVPRSRSI